MIVSNDAASWHWARVVVVPFTSNTGRTYPGEAVVTLEGQSSKAMAGETMASDKARSKSKIDTLSKSNMSAVGKAIMLHLTFPP